MCSPDGQGFPHVGCFEVVENEKLVWPDVLEARYQPADGSSKVYCVTIFFAAVISLEPHGKGTKYTALAIYGREVDRKKHEDMGFNRGWGKALDQLVTTVKKM